MSTHKIDDILSKKASQEIDKRLTKARETFATLVYAVREGTDIDYQDTVILVLSQGLLDEYTMNRISEWTKAEREHHKINRRIRDVLQKTMATELVERLDVLGEEVDALREEFQG